MKFCSKNSKEYVRVVVAFRKLILPSDCSPSLFIQHFRVILNVRNVFFLKEIHVKQKVFIIFILRSVCVAFLPKVSRGKVPVYPLLPSLPTQQNFLGAAIQFSFLSHCSPFWENIIT